MAHFAELDENNVVVSVHYCDNENLLDENGECCDEIGYHRCVESCNHSRFVQTSRSGSIRGRFAKIGDIYDESIDRFISPKPVGFSSFIFDEISGDWIPPVERPKEIDGYEISWEEDRYQLSGIGWVYHPIMSELQRINGSFERWNESLEKYEIVESPLTQEMIDVEITCSYNEETEEFEIFEPVGLLSIDIDKLTSVEGFDEETRLQLINRKLKYEKYLESLK